MCEVTEKDKVRNEHVRWTIKVAPFAKKYNSEKSDLIWTYYKEEKGHIQNLGGVTHADTRKAIEAKTENQVKTRVQTRYGMWVMP